MKALLFFFCLIILFACEKKPSERSRNSVEIEVLDSVKIDLQEDLVRIYALNSNGNMLGLNSNREKLYLFNSKGKILSKIANLGGGPNEYSSIHKIGLNDNDEIFVVADRKILRFSGTDHRNISSYPFKSDEILPLRSDHRAMFTSQGDLVFSSSSLEYSPEESTYFEAVHTFTQFNAKQNLFRNLGGYPESSIYRNSIFKVQYDAQIYASAEENIIYSIFPYEDVIYRFDLSSGVYLEPIDLNLKAFSEIENGKADDPSQMIYMIQKNSSFRDFVVGNRFVIVYYRLGLKEEDISTSLVGYNKNSRLKRAFMISFFDKKTGTPLGEPLKNDEIKNIVGFDNEDNLIYHKVNEKEELIVYKAKLNAR